MLTFAHVNRPSASRLSPRSGLSPRARRSCGVFDRQTFVATKSKEKGIFRSTDGGATWKDLGTPAEAVFGPYFGKDGKHFVVVGKGGFHETKDGGKTWRLAAPLPPGFTIGRVGPNYAWDPNADIFYASTMGKPAFKWQR